MVGQIGLGDTLTTSAAPAAEFVGDGAGGARTILHVRDVRPFELGLPGEPQVRFVDWTRPHDDALTFVGVELHGPGLAASCSVESLDGDSGFLEPPVRRGEDSAAYDSKSLSEYLRELSQSPQEWEGHRAWRSLGNELKVSATCDPRGHVALTFTIQPRPWQPTWAASVSLQYPLGDLDRIASEMEAWFRPQ